jgi:hypothetical protein
MITVSASPSTIPWHLSKRIPFENWPDLVNDRKSQSLFGERVTIANYPEKGESIVDKDGDMDKSRVPDWKSRYSIKLDRTAHPLPEVKSDKATIVVVCPPLIARETRYGAESKLHANRKVIAVNEMGTYSIAYVDPGKYSFIAHAQNANGFEMDLEAGKTYYFIQEMVIGAFGRLLTTLSRNSPEVVMYLVDNSLASNRRGKYHRVFSCVPIMHFPHYARLTKTGVITHNPRGSGDRENRGSTTSHLLFIH